MGSSSSRIGSSPPSSSSPNVHRRKPRKFSSLVCGCSSSHAPLEMEDYPDEYMVNSSEICGDPMFSEVQKPKEELHSIPGTDTGGLVSSADDAANLSLRTNSEVQGNWEQDRGNYEVNNHEDHLLESGELVPPSLVSASSPNRLDRDRNTTTSSTLFDETQSSEMVSVHISPNGIAVYGVDDRVINGVSDTYPEDEDVISEVEMIENKGAESRAVFCSSGSSTSGASDLPISLNSAGGDTSTELIPVRSEFPIFDRELGREPESVVEVDVVSVSSSALSTSVADSTGWEARRDDRRSFWDVFSGHTARTRTDANSSTIVISTSDESDYQGSRERWLFDRTDLFSDEGARGDSRYGGGILQRSNDRQRRRRFEFWDRLRSGLYEHSWHNTSCPLGIHRDGDECSCDQYLTEELSARSSISRIIMLAEALFEVLDEIHRQPMSFSWSMGPVTAPESVVDSFPLKSYEKSNQAETEDSVEQCNICFAEYEEGDKIRVLPCHHEYHMECVDKWLKEIHGVCPLCRGDVREGFVDTSASSSDLTSS